MLRKTPSDECRARQPAMGGPEEYPATLVLSIRTTTLGPNRVPHTPRRQPPLRAAVGPSPSHERSGATTQGARFPRRSDKHGRPHESTSLAICTWTTQWLCKSCCCYSALGWIRVVRAMRPNNPADDVTRTCGESLPKENTSALGATERCCCKITSGAIQRTVPPWRGGGEGQR